MTALLWFRRDLRLGDHPALAAASSDGPVVPLFVLDPALWDSAPANRRAYLVASLRALDEQLDGRLVVRSGRPDDVVPQVVREARATAVHVSADTAPYGLVRDARVERALGDVPLVRTGSAYAVTPGRVRTGAGRPYQVFTPFLRAWSEHGWRSPALLPDVDWGKAEGEELPQVDGAVDLPAAGEQATLRRWRDFLDERLADYPEDRDRPDRPGTSHLSIPLRWGEIHPRTLLADLAKIDGPAAATYRAEIAWREFHADVLWHRPDALRDPLKPEFARMEHDEPGPELDAWCRGATGFPLVDAGMRQLVATGWMHNRVRMVTASFLVKDLHVHWSHGARFFLEHLLDGDQAQNQLNWQWVAGSGADASPWFRVFNPETQRTKFDPDGAYAARWVPELGGPDYPAPIVDHAVERREALDRLERMKA